MDRSREPAMPSAAGGTRPGPAPAPYTPGALRALRRGWALTRWGGLVMVVGLGTAALVATIVFLLVTLLDSSL